MRLADQIHELANTVDDMLAGGAPLEEVAEVVALEQISMPPINRYGQNREGKDAMPQIKKGRNVILESAFELLEGETSPVMEMPDGRFIAVHLGKITPKAYTPFEEVRDDLREKWVKDQRHIENRMRSVAFLTELEESGKNLKEYAAGKGWSVQRIKGVSREGEPQKPLLPRSIGTVFQTGVGSYAVLEIEGGNALAQVTDFHFPPESAQEMDELRDNVTQGMQDEAMSVYLADKFRHYGAAINEDLLGRLYGPGAELN